MIEGSLSDAAQAGRAPRVRARSLAAGLRSKRVDALTAPALGVLSQRTNAAGKRTRVRGFATPPTVGAGG